MERAEMRRLLDWKSSPQRKPLLLFGARQVGKSYLIEQFARENYEKYALFNIGPISKRRTTRFSVRRAAYSKIIAKPQPRNLVALHWKGNGTRFRS